MGKLVELAAAIICVGAGLYLLLSNTAASDSYLQVIAHGMGAYMIGKGLFIGRSLDLQTDAGERLRRIAKAADGLDDEPETKPVKAF